MSWGTYDDDKITELILYVAGETEADETVGMVKLNKILYFGELTHMKKVGRPITGADYQKLPRGPALRRMLPIVRDLEANGGAEVIERNYLGRTQKHLAPRRPADLSEFSGEEIAAVDSVIRRLWGKTATETSDLSHGDLGWQAVDEGDSIPFTMALIVEDPEVTDQMRTRAHELALEQN